MKIEHLEERALDYSSSIKTVVDKRLFWKEYTKPLLLKTLMAIVSRFDLGWTVQDLKWLHSNEAVNVSFDSFPPALIDCTNLIPAFQFIPGGALIFSQSYSGDVAIFLLFPDTDQSTAAENIKEMGNHLPSEITEKLIIEKVDEFLKEMIQWEVPTMRKKVGY